MIYQIAFLVQLALFFTRARCVQMYSSQTHFCCRGSVYAIPDRRNDYTYYCCGSLLALHGKYQYSNVPLCCQDILYENTTTFTHACCGPKKYDTLAETCLNQIDLISIPRENTDERMACGKSKDNFTFYADWKELCCSGVVHKKENNVQCCGETVHDPIISLCCDGHVVALQQPRKIPGNRDWNYYEEWECCGKIGYNSNEQQCCDDKVLDKPEADRSRYQCCGHELIINRSLICVVDRLEEREDPKGQYQVCGGQLYDGRWRRGKQKVCHRDSIVELGYREGVCSDKGEAVKYVVDKNKVCCPSQIVYLSEEDQAKHRSSCCDESVMDEPRSPQFEQPGAPPGFP